MQRLLELLQDAGHTDFRDARGPMGFTQRQAGGKFTADEAEGFIDQLETAEYEADQAAQVDQAGHRHPAAAGPSAGHPAQGSLPSPPADSDPARRPVDGDDPIALAAALLDFTSDQLLDEVRRRGITVTVAD